MSADPVMDDLMKANARIFELEAKVEQLERERDAALHNALHPHHGCLCSDDKNAALGAKVERMEAALREIVRRAKTYPSIPDSVEQLAKVANRALSHITEEEG